MLMAASTEKMVRLTPTAMIQANLVSTAKASSGASITRGQVCKLSSNKWVPISTITDATKSNILGVAENRSPASAHAHSAREVDCYVFDGQIQYEVAMNTAVSVTAGAYFKMVTTKRDQFAISSTVTDDRIAVATRTFSGTTNRAEVIFIPHSYDLERG
jgi:hypothetical protein